MIFCRSNWAYTWRSYFKNYGQSWCCPGISKSKNSSSHHGCMPYLQHFLLFFPSKFFISFWTVSFEVLQLFFHYIVFYNISLSLQCSQNPLSIAKYQNDKEVSLKFYPTCLIVIIVMLVLHVHIQIIYAIKAVFLLIYWAPWIYFCFCLQLSF